MSKTQLLSPIWLFLTLCSYLPVAKPTDPPTISPINQPYLNFTNAPTLLPTDRPSNPFQEPTEPLRFPRVVESVGGVLDVTLTLEYANHVNRAITLANTRLFDGIMPGPTYIISPGDTMKILYQNKLEERAKIPYRNNLYGIPDHTNLHYHGMHVSAELPSDDVRWLIKPGDELQYETFVPDFHIGGTQWIHPHVHGSSTLQTGGGAAITLIVRDPPGYLPDFIANAPDLVLMVQTIYPLFLTSVAQISGDSLFAITAGSDKKLFDSLPTQFRLVNGQYQPTMSATTGQWARWRVLHGGWLEESLNIKISGNACEMVLLAKDGNYILDFPRPITLLATPSGGRADIMVRCNTPGTYEVIDGFKQIVWFVRVEGRSVNDPDLSKWEPKMPSYLRDLRNTPASEGCSCMVFMDTCTSTGGSYCINNVAFTSRFLHETRLGSVVQRDLIGVDTHPYHQHVYPYQIVGGIKDSNKLTMEQKIYFQEGDWHDTLTIENLAGVVVPVRYVAENYSGNMMIHCHRLDHEDLGMMALENFVVDGECKCDVLSPAANINPTPPPTPPPIRTPTAAPTKKPFCFSGTMTVDVKESGPKRMHELRIGDKVLTGAGFYTEIYSFGHYEPEGDTEFLQIGLAGSRHEPLEITPDHLIYVKVHKAKTSVVPAGQVSIGDIIMARSNFLDTTVGFAKVISLQKVKRRGMYAPFTRTGDLVVNGAVVSNYIALPPVFEYFLSYHQQHVIQHLSYAPYSVFCQMLKCDNESYDPVTGLSIAVSMWIPFLSFLEHTIKALIGREGFSCWWITVGVMSAMTWYLSHRRHPLCKTMHFMPQECRQ